MSIVRFQSNHQPNTVMKKFIQFLRNLFVVMAKSESVQVSTVATVSQNMAPVPNETSNTAPIVFIPKVRKEVGNGSRAATFISPKKALVQTKAGGWLVFRIVRHLDDGTTILRRAKHPRGGIVSAHLFPV